MENDKNLARPAELLPRSTIVEILKKSNAGVSVKNLTRRLGLDEKTVRGYLEQLEQIGIVSVNKENIVSLRPVEENGIS